MVIKKKDMIIIDEVIAIFSCSFLKDDKYGLKKQSAKRCFDHFGADRILHPKNSVDLLIVEALKGGIKNAVPSFHTNRDQVWYYFKKDLKNFSISSSSCGRKSKLQKTGCSQKLVVACQ